MSGFKPVTVSNGAFNFCKYTMALLLWISIVFHLKLLVALVFCILILSAILKVKKSPLVLIYTYTVEKQFPSKKIVLDEKAICFAHKVGAVMSGIALIFLYLIHPLTGWIITAALAVLKSSAAMGFCGAAKLYSCLNNPNGQCCRIGKKVKKHRTTN